MKTIVITGANRGLGLELVKIFSKDYIVYAICRDAANFPSNEKNENVEVVSLDITDDIAVINFADQLKEENRVVDLLINNAGVNDTVKDDVDLDETVITGSEKISNVFTTNVIAPILLSDGIKPLLKKSSEPMVISVSSQMSRYENLDGYNAEHWPYSTSKAALNFATAAFSVNQPRIKMITVDPGWMKTRMGGKDAELEPSYTANCIYQLYKRGESLQTGKLYSLNGEVLSF